MSKLLNSIKAKVLNSDPEVIDMKDVETKAFPRTNNVWCRAKTSKGNTVTFWINNASDVVEETADGKLRLLPSTTISSDGALIPGGTSLSWD